MAMTLSERPVDAVITWVNGQDSKHRDKLHEHYRRSNLEISEEMMTARYDQCGEIDYCVVSLLRFAPWIRTIYLVTDAQTPAIYYQLQQTPYAAKIKLIDHCEIFRGLEHCMPSFNSLSIESVLWRIPSLSDNFIYLNDDFFLIRPVQQENFFKQQNSVLRGNWKTTLQHKWMGHWFNGKQRLDAHRKVQEKSARLVGFNKKFFHLPHAPLSLKKSTLEGFFDQHPDLLQVNASYNIRNREQFWPMSLAQHLEIKNQRVVFDDHLKSVYVDAGMHSFKKIKRRLKYADKKKQVAFICMQSINVVNDATRRLMLDWLHKRIYN